MKKVRCAIYTRKSSEEGLGQEFNSLDAQREAGLDYLSDGLLNWQDIFRPFDEAARGLEPGPLTRFLNTNTFYRRTLHVLSDAGVVGRDA